MSIEQLELYCKQAYEEANAEARNHAEQACLSIVDNSNCFEMCRLLLERADSHYSQIIAISSLTKLINRNQCNLTIDNRLEMRNMCLNYLMQRDDLAAFVIKGMISLISRITKLGWLDSTKEDTYPFREIIGPLVQMIKSGQPRPMLMGVQILHSIVYEFNQSYEGEVTRSTIVIRKIANNFREHQLFDIFVTSLDLLGRMSSNIKSLNLYDNIQHSIVQYSLKLTLACLSYDFIGTSGGEEVCDDMVSVQVPTNWRQAFLSPTNNPDPVPLFFELFKNLPSELGEHSLACLVQVASFRRSFFNNNERQTFLKQLTIGVCELLTESNNNNNGSNRIDYESGCYHELCRLICRLKSNFQLSELVSLSEYSQFIELLSNFTIRALDSNVNSSTNSLHYLLLTWQRLVASLPYLRSTQPHMLETHCPPVLDCYVRAKLRSCQGNSDRDVNSSNNSVSGCGDLEDGANIPQELEAVAVLARCQYSRTANMLVSFFDEAASNVSNKEPIVRIRELCWLVLLMGSCVAGRVGGVANGGTGNTLDDCDRLDGELVGRVLQLVMQGCVPPDFCTSTNDDNSSTSQFIGALAALEVATIHFLDQLRRVYLCSESGVRAIRLYETLQARVGIADDSTLLEAVVRKVLQNLRMWGACSNTAVLNSSLGLLHELSLGAVAKRVVRLPIIQSLLQHQTTNEFPFLSTPSSPGQVAFGSSNSHNSQGKMLHTTSTTCVALQLSTATSSNATATAASSNPRTCFYACLTRLFLLSPNITDEPGPLLYEFLEPLSQASKSIMSCNDSTVSKLGILGLIRDIRGVALACHSKAAFQALFDWLFPSILSHLLIAVELWGPTDEWGISLGSLRLMAELCLSRNNRLQPQVTSCPSGELVFRAAAAMLSCYGRKIPTNTTANIDKSPRYLEFVRESTACLDILRNLLIGNYVNFGALPLYSDDSLNHCLYTFLQLMIILPSQDLLAFPKLARSYYSLADSITQDHLMWLGAQQSNMILYFVNTICDGLSSTALPVSSSCCSSLDNLATFLLRLLSQRDRSTDSMLHQNGYSHTMQHQHHSIGGLSDQVKATLDGFYATSQLLENREASAKSRWRLLVSPESRQLTSGIENSQSTNAVQSNQLMAILARCMEILLESLMQPECKNQWAMSRPLLGLILLDTKAFEELQAVIIRQRGGGDYLKSAFQRLMEDVNCSLSIRNRDKFTQNLNSFRHSLVNPSQSTNGGTDLSTSRTQMDHLSEEMVA